MNILSDFHHSDLWWSHHLIFEAALGHTLYRPRGMEWYERGYYYQNAPHVARQFLVDSMFTLEAAVQYPSTRIEMLSGSHPGLRASMDTIAGCRYYPLINTLSLDEFRDAKIDVIMPTLSDNQEPWLRLRKDFKPGAKLLREEGNVHGWVGLNPEYGNVLTSDLPTFRKSAAPNKLLYHQRFDSRVFTYQEPTVFNRITCFMPAFRGCPDLVSFFERHDLMGMEFVDYGHSAKRGFLNTKERYAEEMRRTTFVWHVKPGGDGFGHVLHNSFAMGRPVITVGEDYRDTIAQPLLLDGETCILIGRDPHENSKKIRSLSHPDAIRAMSRHAADRFKQAVDYEGEKEQIRTFLERLV